MTHAASPVDAPGVGGNRARSLVDPFGRRIGYVRLSVTDRCDLRCRYCMSERMQFVPNRELLTVDELLRLADRLIARGVTRIRLTGGEPLVRRDIAAIVARIGSRIGAGLEEMTLTTNGTQLPRHAEQLRAAGIRRVNVSLDSLDPERFRVITRRGDLAAVLAGIAAARAAGLAVKINMVALAGLNDDDIVPMVDWCIAHGHDLTLIETMPLGEVEEARSDRYLPLDRVRSRIESRYGLTASAHRTGGPARYFEVVGTPIRLGFITPLTDNFCASCNRIRITATGTVYGCLGRPQHIELRGALRAGDDAEVERLLELVVAGKPLGHAFAIDAAQPAVARHMSVTGG